VTELARDLKECSVEYCRIGALGATAYRSLHVGQLDVELLGELMTQAVRRHAEFLFGNAGLSHHVVEALEGLLKRETRVSQMRGRVRRECQSSFER
jgi:hypothetical protein